MGLVLISLDDVLRSHLGQPISDGSTLYRAMCEVSRVGVVLDDLDLETGRGWLRRAGLVDHVEVIPGDPRFEGPALRIFQIERARARDAVSMLIDGSPANIAAALKLGVTGLLFSQPKYMRPDFRPDAFKTIKTWDQIQAELDEQIDVHTRDDRFAEPEVVTSD